MKKFPGSRWAAPVTQSEQPAPRKPPRGMAPCVLTRCHKCFLRSGPSCSSHADSDLDNGLLLGLGRPNLGAKQIFQVAARSSADDLLEVAEHTRLLRQDGTKVADCLWSVNPEDEIRSPQRSGHMAELSPNYKAVPSWNISFSGVSEASCPTGIYPVTSPN